MTERRASTLILRCDGGHEVRPPLPPGARLLAVDTLPLGPRDGLDAALDVLAQAGRPLPGETWHNTLWWLP